MNKQQSHLFVVKNFELASQGLGGLESYLIEARKSGKSYGQMSKELSNNARRVAKTTVYEWVQAIEAQLTNN